MWEEWLELAYCIFIILSIKKAAAVYFLYLLNLCNRKGRLGTRESMDTLLDPLNMSC